VCFVANYVILEIWQKLSYLIALPASLPSGLKMWLPVKRRSRLIGLLPITNIPATRAMLCLNSQSLDSANFIQKWARITRTFPSAFHHWMYEGKLSSVHCSLRHSVRDYVTNHFAMYIACMLPPSVCISKPNVGVFWSHSAIKVESKTANRRIDPVIPKNRVW